MISEGCSWDRDWREGRGLLEDAPPFPVLAEPHLKRCPLSSVWPFSPWNLAAQVFTMRPGMAMGMY